MKIKLNEQGLLPAIAQDANTGEVLMMGYMNPGSLKRTMEGIQAPPPVRRCLAREMAGAVACRAATT